MHQHQRGFLLIIYRAHRDTLALWLVWLLLYSRSFYSRLYACYGELLKPGRMTRARYN